MKTLLGLMVMLALLGCTQQPGPVTVEFRLAETEPGEGLAEVTIDQTGEKFYLHDEVLISNADIASASVTMWNQRPAVDVILTEAGREKFARLTRENLKRRVGMLVDGKLASAPIINAPILEGRAIINGDFSEKEARRIAEGIVLKVE
jgi:SecD/SecF fusion protein